MGTDFDFNEDAMKLRLVKMVEYVYDLQKYAQPWMPPFLEEIQTLYDRSILARDCLLEQKLCMPEKKWDAHQKETFLVLYQEATAVMEKINEHQAALLS